jgi:hypothetical protein
LLYFLWSGEGLESVVCMLGARKLVGGARYSCSSKHYPSQILPPPFVFFPFRSIWAGISRHKVGRRGMKEMFGWVEATHPGPQPHPIQLCLSSPPLGWTRWETQITTRDRISLWP